MKYTSFENGVSGYLQHLTIVVFILAVSFPNTSLAQCSVSADRVDSEIGKGILVHSRNEEIYDPRDMDDVSIYNGGRVASAAISYLHRKNSDGQWKVIVSVGSVRKDDLVPRELQVNVEGYLPRNFEPEDYWTKSSESATIYYTSFNFEERDMEFLSGNIEWVQITDTRKNIKLQTEPYSKVFSEQISCIREEISKRNI